MTAKQLHIKSKVNYKTVQRFLKSRGKGNFQQKALLLASAIVVQENGPKFTWLDFLLDIQVNGLQNSYVIACSDSIGATHDDARNLLTILIQVVESFDIGAFGSLTIKQHANPFEDVVLPIATISYFGLTIHIKADSADSGGVRFMSQWHQFESIDELVNTIKVLSSTYY